MNEPEDYDFNISRKLSCLFGEENSLDSGNTSLIYKAPKKPTVSEEKETKAPTKFFYKYVNLFETCSSKERQFGKHIAALLKSDSGMSEILIYQTKNNITIRMPLDATSMFFNTRKKNSLSLLVKDQNLILDFMSDNDYDEFLSELPKFGGIVKKNVPLPVSNIPLPVLTDSNPLSSILDPVEAVDITSKDNFVPKDKEKESILARLAKMGLSQLPSFPSVEELDSRSDTSLEKSSSTSLSTVSNKKYPNERINDAVQSKYILEKEQKIVETENKIIPISTSNVQQVEENNYDFSQSLSSIQSLNPNRQTDLLSLMLTESRINNLELQRQISSVMLKINEITESKEHNEDRTVEQLKSKIRAYELRVENLEKELNKIGKYCNILEEKCKITKSKLEIINNSSQTDEFQENLDENKLKIVELLDIMKHFSEENDSGLKLLKTFKETLHDEELQSECESTINFLLNNMNKIEAKLKKKLDIIQLKSDFAKDTKSIMSQIYSNILKYVDSEKGDVIANYIRNATAELIRIHNVSIENAVETS